MVVWWTVLIKPKREFSSLRIIFIFLGQHQMGHEQPPYQPPYQSYTPQPQQSYSQQPMGAAAPSEYHGNTEPIFTSPTRKMASFIVVALFMLFCSGTVVFLMVYGLFFYGAMVFVFTGLYCLFVLAIIPTRIEVYQGYVKVCRNKIFKGRD